MASSVDIHLGGYYQTQLKGQTITVRVIEFQQDFSRRGGTKGKWVCLNEATSRRLRRTSRQLHAVPR